MDVMPLLLLVAGERGDRRGRRAAPRCPAPLLLVAAGLSPPISRACPDYTLDPHIVLPLLLPPLLYTAALDSSYLDLRANLRPVALLSVGYVLFATFAVGWVAYLVVPDLPLTAALVLGAVVAPPDAVAATAIARRVGLPQPDHHDPAGRVPGERRDRDHRLQGGCWPPPSARAPAGAGGIGEFRRRGGRRRRRRSRPDGAAALAAHPHCARRRCCRTPSRC